MQTKKPFTSWQNIETLQSKEIIYELIQAKSYQLARLLISNTGCGKTNTIAIFQKAKPDHTYVVTVGDSYRLVDIVNRLLELLGIEVRYKRDMHMIREKLDLIAARLKEIKKDGGKPIIVLDEAENLKPQVLKMIKELYDAVIKYCSITLIGTEQIMDAILNTRNKNRQSVPQLYRRFKAGIRHITPINKARDFKPFFERYLPGLTDVQDILLDVCENYGELHDYLQPVLQYCEEKNEMITEKIFRNIHKMPKNSNQLKKIA